MAPIGPVFHSLVLDEIAAPDYLDVIAVPLPPRAPIDPQIWASELFTIASTPVWVRAAFVMRQALAPLMGVPRGDRATAFAVQRVAGEEALIVTPDGHLDFACAVGVDRERRLVRVVTAVRLHGWRGRLYFVPVRLAHPVVVESMLRRTAARLGRVGRYRFSRRRFGRADATAPEAVASAAPMSAQGAGAD